MRCSLRLFNGLQSSTPLIRSWTIPTPEIAKPTKTRETIQPTFKGIQHITIKQKHTGKQLSVVPITPEHTSKKDLELRHTFRAILRECTYLPDVHARRYVSRHVVGRFKDLALKRKRHDLKESDEKSLALLSIARNREARQVLHQLQRANAGHRHELRKALLTTYGRIGKRRRQLLAPLMVDCEKTTIESNELEGKAAGRQSPEQSDRTYPSRIVDLHPGLQALLKSQMRADPPSINRASLRKLEPDIPKLNARMQPMPKSRAKNLAKKWYADLMDRVLPPLPAEEWHHLQRLAHGLENSLQPERRTLVGERVSKPPSALESLIDFPRESVVKSKPHDMTPRFMRRLYAEVFEQCPLMGWDDKTGKWSISWGSRGGKRASQAQVSTTPKAADVETASTVSTIAAHEELPQDAGAKVTPNTLSPKERPTKTKTAPTNAVQSRAGSKQPAEAIAAG